MDEELRELEINEMLKVISDKNDEEKEMNRIAFNEMLNDDDY